MHRLRHCASGNFCRALWRPLAQAVQVQKAFVPLTRSDFVPKNDVRQMLARGDLATVQQRGLINDGSRSQPRCNEKAHPAPPPVRATLPKPCSAKPGLPSCPPNSEDFSKKPEDYRKIRIPGDFSPNCVARHWPALQAISVRLDRGGHGFPSDSNSEILSKPGGGILNRQRIARTRCCASRN